MAWTADFANLETIVHTKLNSIIDNIKNWGGNVNAGGHNLSNVGTLSFTGGGYVGSIGYLIDLTLTGATHEVANTDASPAVTTPAEGSRLVVFLKQDGTGGRAITWSSGFETGLSVEIDITINGITRLQFQARADNKWYLVAPPMLGVA